MAENISIHDRAIKGGLARKAKLTSEERSASARNAANRRWGTQNDNDNGSVCFWGPDYLAVGTPYPKSKRNPIFAA